MVRMGMPAGAIIITTLALLAVGAGLAGETGGQISMETAKELALGHTGGGDILNMGGHQRGRGQYVYRFEILADTGMYHIEIDAATGQFVKLIQKGPGNRVPGAPQPSVPQGTPPAAPPGPRPGNSRPAPSAGANPAGGLSLEQAQAIALRQTNGGAVIEVDTDHKRGGRIVYEFEIINDGVEFDIEIDGHSGDIIEFKRKDKRRHGGTPITGGAAPATGAASQGRVDSARAMALALEKVGGGTVSEYELDDDDGWLTHEVDVIKDGRKHKLRIDAQSGAVWER